MFEQPSLEKRGGEAGAMRRQLVRDCVLSPEERLDGLVMPVEAAEKILVRNALRSFGGNREQAARALGISERTLYRKIRQWGTEVTG